jgi:hypothetical protein
VDLLKAIPGMPNAFAQYDEAPRQPYADIVAAAAAPVQSNGNSYANRAKGAGRLAPDDTQRCRCTGGDAITRILGRRC